MSSNTIMSLCGALLAIPTALCAAVPQLKGMPEAAGTTGLKVKPPTGAKMVQAFTPKGQSWTFRRGTEKWTETHYDAREIWHGHECGAVWKDRKGNQLLVATPTAFCPTFDQGHAKREDIMSQMAADADTFKDPGDEALARWASEFSEKEVKPDALVKCEVPPHSDVRLVDFGDGSRGAAFFRTSAGTWHYAEFRLAQAAKQKEIEGLMRLFLKGVAIDKGKAAAGGVMMEGKWMTVEVPGYRFKTDLSRSQGMAFVKNAGRLMEAMQAAYRRYVPPQKELGVSTVRVFATREGYNEYMKGATSGCGVLRMRSF